MCSKIRAKNSQNIQGVWRISKYFYNIFKIYKTIIFNINNKFEHILFVTL